MRARLKDVSCGRAASSARSARSAGAPARVRKARSCGQHLTSSTIAGMLTPVVKPEICAPERSTDSSTGPQRRVISGRWWATLSVRSQLSVSEASPHIPSKRAVSSTPQMGSVGDLASLRKRRLVARIERQAAMSEGGSAGSSAVSTRSSGSVSIVGH